MIRRLFVAREFVGQELGRLRWLACCPCPQRRWDPWSCAGRDSQVLHLAEDRDSLSAEGVGWPVRTGGFIHQQQVEDEIP